MEIKHGEEAKNSKYKMGTIHITAGKNGAVIEGNTADIVKSFIHVCESMAIVKVPEEMLIDIVKATQKRMAKLYKNKSNNIDYFIINLHELTEYNCLEKSICDECLRQLTNNDRIILIPILNEAYDYKCGIDKVNWLKNIQSDPIDREIQKRRTNFYIQFFKSIDSWEE